VIHELTDRRADDGDCATGPADVVENVGDEFCGDAVLAEAGHDRRRQQDEPMTDNFVGEYRDLVAVDPCSVDREVGIVGDVKLIV
jgi:hypothetical protein